MISVDKEKARKAVGGDKLSFEELIQERKNDIYRLCYIYLKNQDDSIDMFHESVYRAFLSIKNLNNTDFFNTWLTKIIINCCINFIKKKKRILEKEVISYESDYIYNCSDNNNDMSDSIALNVDIFNAIDKLKLDLKTVIILKFFNDYTFAQIADILSCPIGTIKTRFNRAIYLLKLELNKNILGGNL